MKQTILVERIVARETPFQILSAALGRQRLIRRRKQMRLEGVPQLAIIPDDEIGIEILQFGIYERRLLSLLFDDVLAPYREEFKHKSALDIGANIGNHSVFLSSRFKKVIAFEPGAIASHLLRANLLLNNALNVEPLLIGLSNKERKASLAPSEADNIGTNRVIESKDNDDGEEIELRCGDAVLGDYSDIDPIALVKIDVEGHEVNVLRGLANTLQAHHPIILFETAGKRGPAGSDAILTLLRSYGYQNFYTLAKDFPFPSLRSPFARAAIRVMLGARYTLTRRETFDDRYYNLAIATVGEQLA